MQQDRRKLLSLVLRKWCGYATGSTLTLALDKDPPLLGLLLHLFWEGLKTVESLEFKDASPPPLIDKV